MGRGILMNKFHWTEGNLSLLKNLRIQGYTTLQIAQKFGTTLHTIENATHRYQIPRFSLEENPSIPVFNGDLKLPLADYLITMDYHSPYYSVPWHNRSLAIAKKFGIKKIIIVGDLLDFAFASFFYSEKKPNLQDEDAENKRLIKSLVDSFDAIYLIKGNHEDRLGRLTDAKLQASILLELWAKEAWETKFFYSTYDKLSIGDEWLLIHPKSYSQISGQVAKRLASKFHKNIINAHGHFLSYGYDMSGKYIAVDLGGLFDPEKIEYRCVKTTTHSNWNQGFGMLYRGHFYFFDNQTDWNFWLK